MLKQALLRNVAHICQPLGGFLGGGGGGWLAVGGAGPAAAPAAASGTGSSRSLQNGPGGLPPNASNFNVVAPPVTGVHCPVLEVPSGSALLRYWEPLCNARYASLKEVQRYKIPRIPT